MKNNNEANLLAFNRVVMHTKKTVKQRCSEGIGFIYVLATVCNKFGLSQNLVEYAATES